MTLAEKLERLRLPTMSRQLDQALQHAAQKNLSPAAALEWLADLELEARNSRAVERRFHFSRLHAQRSIDSFLFQHHKSRQQNKARILRLPDLDFLDQGTNIILVGNPGTGQTFLSKIIGWRACVLHRPGSADLRRTRLPRARPADLQFVLSSHRLASQPASQHPHHHQHGLLRVG